MSEVILSQTLRDWVEAFMNRSMRDSLQFWRESGLSMPQISTLMRLHYRGGCPVSTIASEMLMSNAAASQLVERLVQQGLVTRSDSTQDRRVKLLALTPHGQELVDRSLDARRQWLQTLAQSLAPAQQQAIVDALSLLLNAAQNVD